MRVKFNDINLYIRTIVNIIDNLDKEKIKIIKIINKNDEVKAINNTNNFINKINCEIRL